MTSTASAAFRNKKACTAVGAALMGGGALAAALAARDAASGEAHFVIGVVAGILVLVSVVGLALWGVGELLKRLPRVSKLLGTSIGIAGGATLLGISALGWVRFFGFASPGGPAIGSLALGAGCLTFAAGATVMAWCRTPVIVDPKKGQPLEGKWLVTGLVALLVLVMPGFLVGLPMKPKPAATVPMAGESL